MIRYQVTKGVMKYKRRPYVAGDLLPVEFSEKDRHRSTFPRRIVAVEVPDAAPVEKKAISATTAAKATTGVKAASGSPASQAKPNGTKKPE